MRKLILILILCLSSNLDLKAGGIGVGLSAIYNFQTESVGAGFRLNFKPDNRFRVIPQAAYYPGFNKVNEYYAGLALELTIFKIKKYDFYLLAHGGYNAWLNYESSGMEGAKYSNAVLEGGAGIVKNSGCWRPFLEYRYNGKWKETNLRLGIMYVFGCKNKGYGATNKRRRSAVSCPAYN
ncbi:MAG: hypothetical protein JXR60_11850 [Bacteroidales bacterium]|nr:hypothetical protein [Bacteroidales bacterium]